MLTTNIEKFLLEIYLLIQNIVKITGKKMNGIRVDADYLIKLKQK
jgi:hypothetical protein